MMQPEQCPACGRVPQTFKACERDECEQRGTYPRPIEEPVVATDREVVDLNSESAERNSQVALRFARLREDLRMVLKPNDKTTAVYRALSDAEDYAHASIEVEA